MGVGLAVILLLNFGLRVKQAGFMAKDVKVDWTAARGSEGGEL